jgi:DNA-directed RNA polymerase specialized sigma24 family protein
VRVMVNTQTWQLTQAKVYKQLPQNPAGPDATTDLELHHAPRTALPELPKGQLAITIIRYCDDLHEVGTADVMGVSLAMVKSTASRALATLSDTSGLRDDLLTGVSA